jgi:hypothetical protein
VINRIVRDVAACVMAVMLFPTSSSAQTLAASFDELRPLLRPGTEVLVTSADGRRTWGKYVTMTDSSLEVVRPRVWRWQKPVETTFTHAAVTTVKRVDSPWEGAAIGFAVGYIPLTVHVCQHDNRGEMACLGAVYFAGPLFGLAGASVGMFIDRRHNKTIYRAGTPASGATASLSPLLTAKMAGGLVTVRFR